ncbi:MAG: hypothetical protein NT108_01755 [Candidatus Kaiserbacteria bacterium]|nr:hypothetical protein [Candidatus Kaiserbacteria bacterium]
MKNLILIAILATLTLGGCTTMPGVFNGLGEDPMSKLIVYRTDGNLITQEQYEDVVFIARHASIQVGLQLSSATEAAASAAFPYGLAGAAGGIIESGVTAGVAGTAGFLGGLVSGWQTASYANVWLVADITEVTLRDLENAGDKRYHRVHVSAAFTGTGNTINAPARGVIQR